MSVNDDLKNFVAVGCILQVKYPPRRVFQETENLLGRFRRNREYKKIEIIPFVYEYDEIYPDQFEYIIGIKNYKFTIEDLIEQRDIMNRFFEAHRDTLTGIGFTIDFNPKTILGIEKYKHYEESDYESDENDNNENNEDLSDSENDD